jgi:hypothetical protein
MNVEKELNLIEHKICCNEISSEQVFTQMKHLIKKQELETCGSCKQWHANHRTQLQQWGKCGKLIDHTPKEFGCNQYKERK